MHMRWIYFAGFNHSPARISSKRNEIEDHCVVRQWRRCNIIIIDAEE